MSGISATAGGIIQRLLAVRFVRFLAVGVLNTLFGYAIYLVGLFLGAPPNVALGIATVIGAVFNYFSTGRLVFRHAKVNRLFHFLFAYLLIYCVNVGALHLVISAGVPAALAQAVLLPVVAVCSFLLFKFFVFRPGQA